MLEQGFTQWTLPCVSTTAERSVGFQFIFNKTGRWRSLTLPQCPKRASTPGFIENELEADAPLRCSGHARLLWNPSAPLSIATHELFKPRQPSCDSPVRPLSSVCALQAMLTSSTCTSVDLLWIGCHHFWESKALQGGVRHTFNHHRSPWRWAQQNSPSGSTVSGSVIMQIHCSGSANVMIDRPIWSFNGMRHKAWQSSCDKDRGPSHWLLPVTQTLHQWRFAFKSLWLFKVRRQIHFYWPTASSACLLARVLEQWIISHDML